MATRRARGKADKSPSHFLDLDDSQPDPFLDGFREGLRKHGYVEGQNLVLELYYAQGNPGALRRVIPELTRGNIDLVVSSGPATRAIKDVTNVPVLFALSGDPIELGLVHKPGATGRQLHRQHVSFARFGGEAR